MMRGADSCMWHPFIELRALNPGFWRVTEHLTIISFVCNVRMLILFLQFGPVMLENRTNHPCASGRTKAYLLLRERG